MRLPILILAAASSAMFAAQPEPQPTANSAPVLQAGAEKNKPSYPIPYGLASKEEIKGVLDRILGYLETATPVQIVDRDTQTPVANPEVLPQRPGLARGDFLLTSYEWGVTYSGMLQVSAATGDTRYGRYVDERLTTIARLAAHARQNPSVTSNPGQPAERALSLRQVLAPHALDDCGSMGAAMIKASRAGLHPELLRPWIDNYLSWIRTGQFRFPDGTLARNRPLPDSLWLDDLYMSVPALAQMGSLTGDTACYDDAARQILQFTARMFIPEKGLYRHGWVKAMEPHPSFHWARANGWAIVAMTELLEQLPETHPDRPAILALYRSHVAGLAACQDSSGLWHQLLDRPDTYLETSASALYIYAIAHGINRGWLDALAYGPMSAIGWNAIAKNVNATGQVEGTCIGTGMGFEPMFYAYRPTNVLAAHGYGPVLLAGAEMITLSSGKGANAVIHDGGLHFGRATGR